MSKESRLAEVEARYAKERLEAAAPELLAALKSIEWIVGAGGPAFCADCGHYRSTGHSKHCKLASAIAKAEGR